MRSQDKTMGLSTAARTAAVIVGVGLGLVSLDVQRGYAAETEHPPRQDWTFSGPFGKFNPAQLQRGFKIYKEVCSNCHALSRVAFRNLAEEGGPGFTEEQAKTIAEGYKVKDMNDKGEQVERTARLSDYFPSPFPNEDAARAANGGAAPPDMSTLAKARTYERGFPTFLFDVLTQFQEQGPDYIHAILTGYKDPPKDAKPPKEGAHYNEYFAGHWIGMAPPLTDGQVEYTDGTKTTVDQYGKDIASFLQWAAEPHLEQRKRMGLTVMFFLIIFAGLLYFTKKRVWQNVAH